MRVLVVDDEQDARARLTRLLREMANVEVVGEAGDGLTALGLMATEHPDAVFLDVQMPGLTGFDVVMALPAEDRPLVVFVTAYDQYALKAFEVSAVDYLLKPVATDRLTEAIARLSSRETQSGLARLTGTVEQGEPLRHVVGKQRQRWHVLPIESVEGFIADQELVFAVTAQGRYLVNRTLRELDERLDPQRFVRVHKQAIVSLLGLVVERQAAARTVARLPSGLTVPVSRRYASPLRQILKW